MPRKVLMQDVVTSLISKPSHQRANHDIEVVLPWLRKKSELLNDLDRDVLISVVRGAECERCSLNDVIVRQGEEGNSLYIILTGSVGVYVDGSKSGEDDLPQQTAQAVNNLPQKDAIPGIQHQQMSESASGDIAESHEEKDEVIRENANSSFDSGTSDPQRAQQRLHTKSTNRNNYGKWVVTFENGKCFGELALINENSIRNATIIAEEDTVLLVIHRSLYNDTLKEYQEKEYQDRQDFIESHPLFRGWNAKYKKLLEMSLVKETYSYMSTMIRQGEPFRGIFFIRKGRARVHVEPGKHSYQYPERWPFKSENDFYELELIRKPKKLPPMHVHINFGIEVEPRSEYVRVRRFEGYAASEKRNAERSITLCTLEEGEIFGDIEMISNLQTYMQKVVCVSHTVVYILTPKNFERLISMKNNRSSLKLLQMLVETKLRNRKNSVQGTHVPLLKHLLFKLAEERKPVPIEVPPLRGTKQLPEREVLFQHLISSYVQNKAELIEPRIPGAVYLREMMREKAKIREEVSKRRKDKLTAKERMADQAATDRKAKKKRNIYRKHPRSTKTLLAALDNQKDLQEDIQRKVATSVLRETQLAEVRQMYEEKKLEEAQQTSVFVTDPETHKTETTNEDNKPNDDMTNDHSTIVLESDKSAEKEANVQQGQSHLVTVKEDQEHEKVLDSKERSDKFHDEENRPKLTLERTKTFITELDATSDPGDVHHDSQTDSGERRTESAAAVLHKDDEFIDENQTAMESKAHALEAQQFLSKSLDTRDLQQEEKVKARKRTPPSRKSQFKVHFVQSLMKRNSVSVAENPTYRDWETSDRTLNHLEEKIKDFARKQGGPEPLGLPKLKRFEATDESPNQPLPGGKVFVKRRICAATGKYALNNHSHVHYRVIPKLEQYHEMRQKRMLQMLLTDDARASRIAAMK